MINTTKTFTVKTMNYEEVKNYCKLWQHEEDCCGSDIVHINYDAVTLQDLELKAEEYSNSIFQVFLLECESHFWNSTIFDVDYCPSTTMNLTIKEVL